MPANTKVAPTIKIGEIRSIEVISEDHYMIAGRSFYTRKEYLKRLGFSPTSVQIPYSHVIWGKADYIKLSSLGLFSPILATNSKNGGDKK